MANQQNTDRNLTLVTNLYDEVYTRGNWNRLDQFFTQDVVQYVPAVGYCQPCQPGIGSLKHKETQYRNAFPNKSVAMDDIWGWGDKVVVCWTARGTHKGDYKGVSPTNRNAEVCGISIYHFENGKIASIQQNWDRLYLLEQIGVIESSQLPHSSHRY